jgi:hypothetical protein
MLFFLGQQDHKPLTEIAATFYQPKSNCEWFHNCIRVGVEVDNWKVEPDNQDILESKSSKSYQKQLQPQDICMALREII